jgi:hypothetical protein
MDDNLDDKAAGAALRTHPNRAAAGGRRLRRCCLLSETPRTYRDTPAALPVFYQPVQQAPVAQRWPGDDGKAAPPSLNGLIRLLYERNLKSVKRLEGPRMMAHLLHQDRQQRHLMQRQFFHRMRRQGWKHRDGCGLDDKAAGLTLRTHPTGAAAGVTSCAGVVYWQKPPGCTGICRRRGWFSTRQCNECWHCSVGPKSDGWVAAPPSLNVLVRLSCERILIV